MNDKLSTSTEPITMAFDAAGVQFHKALGHTETYPETTARPIESGIGLKRHLEQLRQELAGDGNERGCPAGVSSLHQRRRRCLRWREI
jgi:hypothetical protein